MTHRVLYKREGIYGGFPVLACLPDGGLTVGIPASPFPDHYGLGDWIVLLSEDQGETWMETWDSSTPQRWPGSSPREKYDRFAAVMPDGTFLAAGSVGWEVWPTQRQEEALKQGLVVREHPSSSDSVIVGGRKLFVQRSRDGGKTWERREWIAPGVGHITAFPRSIRLSDGTILIPVYGSDGADLRREQRYVWRSSDGGAGWRLISMTGSIGNEMALVEVSPGRVLAHIRAEGYLLESWSDDGGLTWSYPLETKIWGYPAHLLRLQDGRILCTFGYRREPMGVRAALSQDGGVTWDIEHIRVLRDDGGVRNPAWPGKRGGGSDVGYPMSTQLSDGRIFTVYYITLRDGITHSAATLWDMDQMDSAEKPSGS